MNVMPGTCLLSRSLPIRSTMRRVSKNCLRQGLSRIALLSPSEGSVSHGYASLAARQPSEPQLPPCDYQPRPYDGPSKPEVLALRKKYLSPGQHGSLHIMPDTSQSTIRLCTLPHLLCQAPTLMLHGCLDAVTVNMLTCSLRGSLVQQSSFNISPLMMQAWATISRSLSWQWRARCSISLMRAAGDTWT